jgi:glyoxylase-like metal-dependent hydrolase (beta-lactamase superfamily II)
MKRTVVLTSIVVVAGGLALGKGVVAQQAAQTGPNVANIEKIKDNLYLVTGGGGNTAVYVTGKGVVLVDTKNPNWGQAIMDKVKTVTDKPVTHIINTHVHGDHTGSNDFFPASVEIVAHANVKTRMGTMPQFASAPQAFPDRTYDSGKLTVLDGADAIDLYHFGKAHTDGDTYVVFRSLKVMHAGDTFPRKSTPFIDRSNGGNGVAYPETLAKVAANVKDVETVIPGHSAVTTWAAFVEYGEFMKMLVDEVKKAKAAGKTAEQAVAEFTLPEKFKDYGTQSLKDNVPAIYADLP